LLPWKKQSFTPDKLNVKKGGIEARTDFGSGCSNDEMIIGFLSNQDNYWQPQRQPNMTNNYKIYYKGGGEGGSVSVCKNNCPLIMQIFSG